MHHRSREDRKIIDTGLRFIRPIAGSYVLLINLCEAQTITIGNLRDVHLPCGYYAYVGSALGGVKSRLNHHLKKDKKLRWHIDYLLQKASITEIIIGETKDRIECAIAQALSSQFDSIPGFGSSDCHCPSHLFFTTDGRQMKSAIMATLELLAVRPKLMEIRGRKNEADYFGKTWGNGMECETGI